MDSIASIWAINSPPDIKVSGSGEDKPTEVKWEDIRPGGLILPYKFPLSHFVRCYDMTQQVVQIQNWQDV